MKETVKFMSVAVLALTLASCGDDKKSDKDAEVELEMDHAMDESMEMDEMDEMGEMNHATSEKASGAMNDDTTALAFTDENAMAVWKAYNAVREALVATDAAKAKQEAAQLAMIFSEDNAKLKAMAEGIAKTEDVAAQREAFSKFSNAVEAYFKSTINAGTLYKQHCPMAFSGEGADWFSNESAIKNPYFGDKMLNCGSVTATITQ
ncbi:MAG: DUF3347 domain-containing protein [Leeuwenhoekiella sp.]|uniref:DUF3347 domain-containing protein n=1 Tax=Leeuwenhoekiella TaxID=283735 RepID=UPI0023532FEF|nr:DUF3347 domain-containing protein [Leeuwenhoekiella blandensis]|tara:strand:- start:6555 stop:7172 length:618 start_codon:yes stop_codon:yes gene_type:complete